MDVTQLFILLLCKAMCSHWTSPLFLSAGTEITSVGGTRSKKLIVNVTSSLAGSRRSSNHDNPYTSTTPTSPVLHLFPVCPHFLHPICPAANCRCFVTRRVPCWFLHFYIVCMTCSGDGKMTKTKAKLCFYFGFVNYNFYQVTLHASEEV